MGVLMGVCTKTLFVVVTRYKEREQSSILIYEVFELLDSNQKKSGLSTKR